MKIVAKQDTESKYGVKIPRGMLLEVDEDCLAKPVYAEQYVARNDEINHGGDMIVPREAFDIYSDDAEVINEMVGRLGKNAVQGLLDAAPEKNYQVGDLVPAGTRLPYRWLGLLVDSDNRYPYADTHLVIEEGESSSYARKILWKED